MSTTNWQEVYARKAAKKGDWWPIFLRDLEGEFGALSDRERVWVLEDFCIGVSNQEVRERFKTLYRMTWLERRERIEYYLGRPLDETRHIAFETRGGTVYTKSEVEFAVGLIEHYVDDTPKSAAERAAFIARESFPTSYPALVEPEYIDGQQWTCERKAS